MRQIICSMLFFGTIILFGNTSVHAQANEENNAFKNYKKVDINGNFLLLDPLLRYKTIQKDAAIDEHFMSEYGDEVIHIECGKIAIVIGFSNGPSDDPNYEIIARKGKKVFRRNVGATSLAVSSSCQLYASGHTDNSFDMRRKFVITDKGVIETVQPFYLVDKVCKTSSAATLTTKPCSKGNIVAILPTGSEVRVLLSEWFVTDEYDDKHSNCESSKEMKESYLVSTPFGLERWSPKTGQCVKVDSRIMLKEDHPNEHYQTQTLFRRV